MRLFSISSILLLGSLSLISSRGCLGNPVHGGVPNLKSTVVLGASLSYKETCICETSPSVKSYSGYVHLPRKIFDPATASIHTISIFFWYFESRNNAAKAPLAMYLAGGPGDSSTFAALTENGPCTVNTDSNSTTANPWSFNTNSNVLYIDQPNHVGFSYDTVAEGFLDALTGAITKDPAASPQTTFQGNFSSQDPASTFSTTGQVAKGLWYFAQVWLADFPEYKTTNIFKGLWGNSYAGTYIPTTAAWFEVQSRKISRQQNNISKAIPVSFDAIGITNGCIDQVEQGLGYAEMAYNNTYGFQAVNETVYNAMVNTFSRPGGCKDMVKHCRSLASAGDAADTGLNITVNDACYKVYEICATTYIGVYALSGRNFYDMAAETPNPAARLYADQYQPYAIGFLNREWVQKELGVTINFTASSPVVADNFFLAGDPLRADMSNLELLLYLRKTVALIYGDRDYQCNWIGGEKLSLALDHFSRSGFRASGYANIVHGAANRARGVVRQYEGLSFSRVFDAGHHVSAYQPETVHRIFNRAMSGNDIATGMKSAAWGGKYASKGPSSSFGIKNKMPKLLNTTCSVLATDSCSMGQLAALADGKAVVKDFIVVEPAN
ncbi:alpha/beta-hydrolase [Saccharata proteae CBS 121410]|uniref:Alpha/beta-hydrolase n=1 Tax=Saccharata proteae CBS 121410 TaxID=1314787 RepID=A0A9P4LXI1_9PEZI|nr:alpha/beta-hydrolase [Saccharata proteae CBS 121410]